MARSTFVPCLSCQRHVRTTDDRCPFCSAALSDAMRAHVSVEPSARVSRSVMLAIGASLALAACGESVSPNSSDARADSAQADRPAVGDTGTPTVADTGLPCELDPACSSADYGAPPPPPMDAGFGTRYGAPPSPADA
ncbi:MAG: hypothetical protein JNK05_32645 [Myxococcales bacterium]|nr:hypothetical protein [Myxococcales bacterium]